MAGNGKYTKFVPDASPKYVRLGQLFAGRDNAINPYAIYLEGTDGAREDLLNGTGGFVNNLKAGARELLQPSKPIDDGVILTEFGAAVDLNYGGAPNTTEGAEVVWAKAGDPVNPFMPDLRSPGPHLTEATTDSNMGDKPAKEISEVSEHFKSINALAYTPGAPGTGTSSPTTTIAPLKKITSLGQLAVPLGTSDKNKPF